LPKKAHFAKIVASKQFQGQKMGEFLTGAIVTKTASLYSVEYQGQLVAQFSYKDQAVMLALDRAKLASLLQNSNIFLLKAA
jgi:hypothetical protein